MRRRDKIALSFFPLVEQEFDFTVYRRPYRDGETSSDFPECTRRRLPSGDLSDGGNPIYVDYWVSFEPIDEFAKHICGALDNIHLTNDFLHRLLLQSCQSSLQGAEFACARGFRSRRVLFVLDKYPEGEQVVWLEPYYLKSTKEFGFLADFKFQAPPHSVPTRRLQQLSLSLDGGGKSNRNFYADRFEKLQEFITRFHPRVFPLASDSLEIAVRGSIADLEVKSLKTKTYVFASERTANSQFTGVKNHGPLGFVSNDAKVYFVYREQDKPLSYDLFRALRGDTFNTFPGMERMFHYEMNNENVGGTAIDDFRPDSLERALESIQRDAGGRPVVPVLITPFSKYGGEEANREYYIAKHTYLKHGVPSQFVSLELLRSKNELKWSVSNIGLQLFAKMGGQPWKVSPQTDDCLIVGLGQSHRKVDGRVERYFAYSVLTESTGLYKELKVLSKSTDYGSYIDSLIDGLMAVFEQYRDQYSSFVVHATFSIRREELDAVKRALDRARTTSATTAFAAVKLNERSKFFGYSTTNNSMVPYESSFVQLSRREYLVWFEGLQYHNPNVRKRIGRPLHVEFIYPDDGLSEDQMIRYLQDAVNLSGANWRGFNAKSLPVSVYYAYLIASYYKEFQTLGLEEIDLEAITPWFL